MKYTPEELYVIARRYCRQKKYFDDSELVQEFVIAAWKAGELNNNDDTIQAYQLHKGRSRLSAIFRARRREAADYERAIVVVDNRATETPVDLAVEAETEVALDKLVRANLTGDKLTIYELRLAGYTLEEIAQKMNKTKQAVAFHVQSLHKVVNRAIKETKGE